MGDAPVIESAGRSHPIATHYLGRVPEKRIDEEMAAACRRALADAEGGLLGKRKIETIVADDLWPLPTYREMLFVK